MSRTETRPRERHARTSNGLVRALSLTSRVAAGPFSSFLSHFFGLFGRLAPVGPSGLAARPRPFRPALAAAFSLLLAAGAAEAQTSGKLVTNLAASQQAVGFEFAPIAQGFTTGSHGDGYVLKDARLLVSFLETSTTDPVFSVSIWSADADGLPGSNLGTLTNPTSLAQQLNTFTASGGGIDLDANTTYFVVLEVTSVGDRNPTFSVTTSDSEDAATGWSIADSARHQEGHRLGTRRHWRRHADRGLGP